MEKTTKPDAGLRSLDHYKTKLPKWRYIPRQKLLPLVRLETPYLAWMQEAMRSPALDSYFALTANLGTHTFFMTSLPIFFWCGYTSLGRDMTHILTGGVFFSGFIKDLLCLPRPLSPPLQRITMSGSAALEYGFPSTHSTNAVSVVVYALYMLHYGDTGISSTAKLLLQLFCSAYCLSIILGRLYCGMHGFVDVIVGSAIGAITAFIQVFWGPSFDTYIHQGSLTQILIVVLIILFLIRIHPEPADDCPCFDDSVASAGVIIGVTLGHWHFSKSSYAWSEPSPATCPFDLEKLGWTIAMLRIVLGVVVVFAWRAIMKPLLLRTLPPIFRVFEKLGLSLPRKYFLQSSTYKQVPRHLKDDDVIPSVSDIPTFLNTIRHPRRRAVSIGPQSEADAYETLAYRAQRRRDSLSSPSSPVMNGVSDKPNGHAGSQGSSSLPKPSKLDIYEGMMGTGFDSSVATPVAVDSKNPIDESSEIPQIVEEAEMFSRLQKPRDHYDVEVVTKLIVYSGIAWIAVEWNPILFQLIGLGVYN